MIVGAPLFSLCSHLALLMGVPVENSSARSLMFQRGFMLHCSHPNGTICLFFMGHIPVRLYSLPSFLLIPFFYYFKVRIKLFPPENPERNLSLPINRGAPACPPCLSPKWPVWPVRGAPVLSCGAPYASPLLTTYNFNTFEDFLKLGDHTFESSLETIQERS